MNKPIIFSAVLFFLFCFLPMSVPAQTNSNGAYVLTNKVLKENNAEIEVRTDNLMRKFSDLDDKTYPKTPLFHNAAIANALTDEMDRYIEKLKKDFADHAGGWTDPSEVDMRNGNATEISEQFFLKAAGKESSTRAALLREELSTYLKEISELRINARGEKSNDMEVLKLSLSNNENWPETYFKGVPAIAALTALNTLQNDIRRIEGRVIRHLYEEAGGDGAQAAASYASVPGAVVSADQMNVLYRGLDNPMSISVPGFSDSQINVNFGGLPARKLGPGKYMIKPTAETAPKCTVSVSAKMVDGSTKSMGSQTYRVRNIPRAEVLFGGKPGGPISKGELLTVRQIAAGLGPEFPFEGFKYAVLGFTFKLFSASGEAPFVEEVTGNQLTETIKSKLQSTKTGDTIVIYMVQVNGPAGKQTLVGTSLEVK